MTDDFASLYDFNRWANDKMLSACRQLSPEQYAAEPAPGWSSVRATVYHIAIVTDGWLRGLADESAETFPAEDEIATPDAAAALLEEAYQRFAALQPKLTPEYLAAPHEFRRGERVAVLPPWVVLRHIVNHATYHRGQVASKLARLGVRQAETDMVYWAMERAAGGA